LKCTEGHEGSKKRFHGWVPRLGPMVGSQGWVPRLGPNVGSQCLVPKLQLPSPNEGAPPSYIFYRSGPAQAEFYYLVFPTNELRKHTLVYFSLPSPNTPPPLIQSYQLVSIEIMLSLVKVSLISFPICFIYSIQLNSMGPPASLEQL
jgi:hypothetical protein